MTRDQFLARLRGVKLLSLDVDGVLTDNSMYFMDDGTRFYKFNVKDGMGLALVRKAGLAQCIITSSETPAIRIRGEVLEIPHVFMGVQNKLEVLTRLCADLGIGLDEVAHIGDDVNDLPVLEAVGCPLTVADAVASVKDKALWISTREGGKGAVREICDLILEARGEAV